jgi:N-acetylneuraminic acid mutarotase
MISKVKILFAVLMISTLSFSCEEDSDDDTVLGDWVKSTSFLGSQRSGAVYFVIENTVYVGLGYDGEEYLRDFYAYNADLGYWEERASFPEGGVGRERAVAFTASGKGYIGLGYNRDLDKEELKDFWEYNPSNNTWTKVQDFPGTARYGSVAFALGGNGYVGAGYDGNKYNSDFYEFNSEQNSWRQIQAYPGEKIEGGMAFVIDGKAYVCGGRNNDVYNNSLYEFNPEGSPVWTSRKPESDEADFDEFKAAVNRHNAVALVRGTKAYIIGGEKSSSIDKTVYEFNSSTMDWDDRTSFEGSARSLAVGFVLNDIIYYGTGQSGSKRYDDIWEFNPDIKYDNDIE